LKQCVKEHFNGYWRESVKLLQFYCKYLPASVLIDMRKILFWRKMFYHSNVIRHICSFAVECRQTFCSSHCSLHGNNFMFWNMFWQKFGYLL